MSFTLYKGVDGFKSIKDDWLSLAEQVSGVQFYQLCQWHGAFLEALTQYPDRFFFIVWRDAGKVQFILPLMHVRQKIIGVNFQVLQLTSHSHLSLVDGLSSHNFNSQNFIQNLSKFLNQKTNLKWHWISMNHVVENSSLYNILQGKKNNKLYSQFSKQSFFIDCSQNLDVSTRHLSTKFKRNVRRQTRKAHELGTIRFEIKKAERLEQCFDTFLALEASGWKGVSDSAIQCHEYLIKFYHSILDNQTPESVCILNTLFIDDELIAAQFGIINSSKMNLLKIAYNESMSKIAPGNILLNYVIQYCVENKDITELCFVTAPKWAEQWKSSGRDVYDYQLFNTSIKARFIQALVSLKFFYRRYLKPYILKFKSVSI